MSVVEKQQYANSWESSSLFQKELKSLETPVETLCFGIYGSLARDMPARTSAAGQRFPTEQDENSWG